MAQRRQPTPVLLPGKSHGWRSLVGCSPWGCKESGMTEWLHFHFSLSPIGEGNGNPLHCSCLENPRDGEAWWAAVYGVTQSWTRLKWLSSSSSSSSTGFGLLCFHFHSFLCLFDFFLNFFCDLLVIQQHVVQPPYAGIFNSFSPVSQSVQFSRSVVSDSLWPHESQHASPPCPSPTPGVHSDSCPSSLWCHPAISSSVIPFSSCP